MTRTRALLPTTRWLAATLVVIVISAVGAYAVHNQINGGNRNQFAVAAEAIEANVDDRIGALNLISIALLLVMSPDGGGITLETVTSVVEGGSTPSIAAVGTVASLVNAFPWDGLSALAFATREPGGEITTSMLPNTGGLTAETLSMPSIEETITSALSTGGPATSRPFEAGSYPDPLYVYVVPVTEDRVVVSFVNPTALVEDAIRGSGADLLHAEVHDLTSGTTLVSTGVSDHPGLTSRFEVAMFDRRWGVTVTPGPDFGWQDSTMPWLSTFAMGIFFAGLVFMVGLQTRRRSQQNEDRLRFARQIDQDKDRFIAAVSHELRTPLTTLVGLSASMAASPDRFDSDEINEFGVTMSQQSKEMAMLVEDLLVAARTREGVVTVVPRRVDLVAEIRSTVQGLGAHGDREIAVEGTAAAWADPLRVRQIIRNLLTNAIRHGGPAITTRAFTTGEGAHVEIFDDGPGIPAAARARMFEPYYRSTVVDGLAPSVGLGLSVARQLAVLMAGDIDYRYEHGRSIFRVTLPLGEPDEPNTEPVPGVMSVGV